MNSDNNLNPYQKKNNELVRSNLKYMTKLRKMEVELAELKAKLLSCNHQLMLMSDKQQELDNVPPFGKIQDVCKATINEYQNLVRAFNFQNDIFQNHALVGLNAIVDYYSDLDIPSKNELNKKPKVNQNVRKPLANVTNHPPKAKMNKKFIQLIPMFLTNRKTNFVQIQDPMFSIDEELDDSVVPHTPPH
ncbi:hypothetical protein HDV02_005395 [Globomyces sp. JEL0801]|nr:hypothetical protein HDV02_005395 [Globomyces sp. JEL0801]